MDKGASLRDRAGGLRPEPAAQSQPEALIPSAAAIRHAKDAVKSSVFRTADDNIDRAVANATYRQQNSEIARCFLRLVAAQGTPTRSAETTGSVGEADGGPVAKPCAQSPAGDPS